MECTGTQSGRRAFVIHIGDEMQADELCPFRCPSAWQVMPSCKESLELEMGVSFRCLLCLWPAESYLDHQGYTNCHDMLTQHMLGI